MHLTQKANLSALKIEVNLFFSLVTANSREILSNMVIKILDLSQPAQIN